MNTSTGGRRPKGRFARNATDLDGLCFNIFVATAALRLFIFGRPFKRKQYPEILTGNRMLPSVRL